MKEKITIEEFIQLAETKVLVEMNDKQRSKFLNDMTRPQWNLTLIEVVKDRIKKVKYERTNHIESPNA